MNISLLKQMAATVDLGGGNSYSVPLPKTTTNGSLGAVLNIVFGTLVGISVIIIVVAGIQFMTSGGNPEQTNKARNKILYAVIGLVISLSAEILINFVLNKILNI